MLTQNRAKTPRFAWAPLIMVGCVLCLLFFSVYFLIFANSSDDRDYSIKLSSKYSVEEMQKFAERNLLTIDYKPSLYTRNSVSFNRLINDTTKTFDVDGNDVLVFLHIQKTAGTSFEKFLVNNLNISRPCLCNQTIKRCKCYRPRSSQEFWLFSRYSTGWKCGLHADWTELSTCVERAMDDVENEHRARRYFYTTFLREPTERFISEYRHVERGANWLRSKHICNSRIPTPEELPLCFDPDNGWENVTLDEFLSCPYNLAFNRQTRMLADLSLVHCYNSVAMPKAERDRILLASAKSNLKNMAFFGIKERMNDSQEIFENVFNLKFTKSLGVWNKSKSNDTVVTELQSKIILERNSLDVELYKYAVKLFDKRLKTVRQKQGITIVSSSPATSQSLNT
ncbi:Heparan sulfate 6-O-sulfotransferase [Aphelenchoides bicaudatus]|nr:Heparan sulfate 6-O-sulfotransferase [Aphelenchoides bicaudatus]